jgi:hypothetical protein
MLATHGGVAMVIAHRSELCVCFVVAVVAAAAVTEN